MRGNRARYRSLNDEGGKLLPWAKWFVRPLLIINGLREFCAACRLVREEAGAWRAKRVPLRIPGLRK